jgi:uncharacterized membrane protein
LPEPKGEIAMVQLSAIPSWNELHLLIIHFPIALLLVAPLFMIAGAVLGASRGRAFLVSAFVLMALGTASLFVAVETGEAASKLAVRTPEIKAVIEQHEELAETTEILFSVLTVAFAALIFAPRLLRRELSSRFQASLLGVFLLFYATGAVFLVNTAHQGGRLVHELGIDAPVASSEAANTARDR